MASLTSLASVISSSATRISETLSQNGIAGPTFDEAGFDHSEREAKANIDHHSLRAARMELINAAHDIINLAMGPVDHVLTLGWSSIDSANIGTIVRLKIAQNVPLGASISSEDLARKIGHPKELLERLVRYAICNGVFREPASGMFAHTAASKALVQNFDLHNVVLLATHEIASMVGKIPETAELQKEDKENAPHAAFNVAYPGYKNVFEYFAQNTAPTIRYIQYLDGMAAIPRFSVQHLTKAWNWSAVGSGTIVDVGGSSGHACFALAKTYPNANFVVQDKSVEALKVGQEQASSDPALEQRFKFTEYDFFTPQPVTADVYLYRYILHDWPDEDVIRILKALIRGLKDGARILINEGIVPEPPATRTGFPDDKQIYINDHIMLGVHNARERSVANFVSLFKEASEDFEYVGLTGGEEGDYYRLAEFSYTKKGA